MIQTVDLQSNHPIQGKIKVNEGQTILFHGIKVNEGQTILSKVKSRSMKVKPYCPGIIKVKEGQTILSKV